jgi:hypothetical protein
MNRVSYKTAAEPSEKETTMRNEMQEVQNRDSWDLLATMILVMVILGILSCATGCTVSIGAEGRTYYPGENGSDPREGFFDQGGMDGMYSSQPERKRGFNTIRENK